MLGVLDCAAVVAAVDPVVGVVGADAVVANDAERRLTSCLHPSRGLLQHPSSRLELWRTTWPSQER